MESLDKDGFESWAQERGWKLVIRGRTYCTREGEEQRDVWVTPGGMVIRVVYSESLIIEVS